MPQHQILRSVVIVAVASLGGAAQAAPANASFNAQVQVLQQIEIRQDANLNFGKIDKPSAGTRTFRVNTDGSTTVMGGGTGGAFIGGHAPGQYDILGTANNAAVLTTVGATCSTPTIRLSAIELDLPTPVVLPINDAKLGGTLRVSDTSAPGRHTCPYTITANYE